eukprot:364299-Chlamydomonas_euryale.AAC.13
MACCMNAIATTAAATAQSACRMNPAACLFCRVCVAQPTGVPRGVADSADHAPVHGSDRWAVALPHQLGRISAGRCGLTDWADPMPLWRVWPGVCAAWCTAMQLCCWAGRARGFTACVPPASCRTRAGVCCVSVLLGGASAGVLRRLRRLLGLRGRAHACRAARAGSAGCRCGSVANRSGIVLCDRVSTYRDMAARFGHWPSGNWLLRRGRVGAPFPSPPSAASQ